MSVVASMKCPQCHRDISVKDPRLLGKKVKCPGCLSPILVPAPSVADEEVELRLAADALPRGTAPRLVNDVPLAPPVLNPVNRPLAPPVSETLPPPVLNPTPRPIPRGPEPLPPPVFQPASQSQFPVPAPPVPTAGPVTPSPSAAGPQVSAAEELRRLRRRSKRSPLVTGLLILLGLGFAGGMGYLIYLSSQQREKAVADGLNEESNHPDAASPERRGNSPYSLSELEHSTELVREFAPTQGEPIDLRMLPDGINFIIHLRPSLLWSEEFDYQVMRASLTEDVTNWLAAKIEEVTKHKPEQIEELTFGVFLGAQGMEPEVSAVVRLKEPGKLSQLTDLYQGSLAVEMPPPLIKMSDTTAVWIHDDSKTIVIWPRSVAGSGALQESANVPADVRPELERLVRVSDRQHVVTIMASPNDLEIAAPKIFPQPASKPLGYVVDWLGTDADFVSWTMHPSPYFYSQLSGSPRSTTNTAKLKAQWQTQLADLPQIMWKDVALKMQPHEVRVRNFVGRFPAMLEAFNESTICQNDSQMVTLTTVLPANATPNIALAALFTASEAEHTNFDTVVAQAPAVQEVKLPPTVVGRMKELKVDAEFERKPIEEAIVYIGGEIKVKVFVDGDAFKDAGWTKNMPQTFNLGKVTGERALAQIINKYDEKLSQMVLSVDEKEMKIHITTRKFAERDNLPIYEFPKFEE